ncbi:hypothetical protein [Mesorhizobium loti]|uniref:hypothetical protein n=1 Tax=Rhizobium loti TaxID=381 RepID=UPI001AEF8D46|nr:hypothetical protein [Mesorhizobium loti]
MTVGKTHAEEIHAHRGLAHFGTAPVGVQWSWSARDGRCLMSAGLFGLTAKPVVATTSWMEKLRWALDHCDGWVKVIIAIAKDKNAKPRSIKECAPTKMQVKVMQLDEGSGEFSLEAFGF